ncbi:MAG: hypothetical protein B0A82_26100 [Alkalinema sp. CACIAM 70d]|nr:MAG: hypothetical protein B0A82_26100 [Alkalinema sp. CACIAM 70d]
MSSTPNEVVVLAQQTAAALIKVVPLIMQFIRAEIRQTPCSVLSVPQFRLLAYLEQQPGTNLSKVAEYLDVTRATASATIERLVQSGYVDRSVDPQERRYVRLHLTDHGLQELEAMRQMIRNQLAALLTSLPPEQLASIETSLEILYQVFQPIV